ncbi:MAG: YgeY family selenium metabolism-linked hydrolase [Anaerolineae bacterium]|nr:YgeY family selenium metabolism-linked hydrolase [Anaerolineae bacterium]
MFELGQRDRAEMVAFLQDLVRLPSYSTHEGQVAQRLAAEMTKVGFQDVRTDRIGNVVGRIGAGAGPVLLYDGHMDIVGPGDVSTWRLDPFAAQIEDGVLYGRGASDMKGALAAMVYGVKALLDRGIRLQGDLYVAGVVQEEPCEGLGVRVLMEEEGLHPDVVLIGEPTGLQISRGQRGRVEIKVVSRGRSCHASAPERGENAIYRAARLIFGVEMLSANLAVDRFLGPGTLAVTQIENTAGSRNAVPDSCTFYVDRRLTLGETEAKALAEIQAIVLREEVQADVSVTEYASQSYTGYEARARCSYPAWALDREHPLVRQVSKAIRDELGYRPEVGKWQFSTDGVYTMGIAGVPTVGFGPGEERHAHTANESIHLDDVARAARGYACIAAEILGARG